MGKLLIALCVSAHSTRSKVSVCVFDLNHDGLPAVILSCVNKQHKRLCCYKVPMQTLIYEAPNGKDGDRRGRCGRGQFVRAALLVNCFKGF